MTEAKSNQPTDETLLAMPLDDLVSYIKEARGAAREAVERANNLLEAPNAELKRINDIIARRFMDQALAAYTAKDKTSGKVTVNFPKDVQLTGDISKTVVWDQDKLKALAATLKWEEVQHYFTIKFSVPEATHKAIPPGDLRDKMDDARTVKYGDLKIGLGIPE